MRSGRARGRSVSSERRFGLVILLVASLSWTACGRPRVDTGDGEIAPASVEHFEGAEPARVRLTEEASQRLDIQTEVVQELEVGGTLRKVIPYAAVLYDTEGGTWTYTNPEPLLFVRRHITVDEIVSGQAILSEGPPAGTAVVTVGGAELYGSESEFEEE